MNIIADKYISDWDCAKRTWRERLFTKPWKPFQKWKHILNPRAFVIGETAYVSYQTYARITADPSLKKVLGLE